MNVSSTAVVGDVISDDRSCRYSMSIKPTLHLLSYKVYIVSVNKEALPSVTHALLGITLKLLEDDPTYRRESFFCFTETCTEYTLLLDQGLYDELIQQSSSLDDDNNIRVSDTVWRPIVIAVGAFGSLTGISKIAASVISPLADQNTSVFCLSTNQEDYVMLKENDLSSTLRLLSSQFRLICDSNHPIDLELYASIVNSKPIPTTTTNYNHGYPNSSSTINTASRPIIHPYSCSDNKLYICNVLQSALSSITQPLLHLMFFCKSSSFFSFSIIGENNISLVLDSKELSRFPSNCVYSNDILWRIFTIGNGPLGFDECGIVAQIATPLADQEISTYYISTYDRDHVLVSDPSLATALEVLNEFQKDNS